jgi:hypothetical protein
MWTSYFIMIYRVRCASIAYSHGYDIARPANVQFLPVKVDINRQT